MAGCSTESRPKGSSGTKRGVGKGYAAVNERPVDVRGVGRVGRQAGDDHLADCNDDLVAVGKDVRKGG